MPTPITTTWGHHLPDPELSRAAAERAMMLQAVRQYRRGRSGRRGMLGRLSDTARRQLLTLAGSVDHAE